MSNIEIVIKIPEEVKNRLCFGITYPKDIQVVCEALNDGTSLPKGHGKLKDVDKIRIIRCSPDSIIESNVEMAVQAVKQYIDQLPTIIESDDEK